MEDWQHGFTKVGAVTTFLLVNAIVTLAMVIAPADSAAMKLASTHKELNLLVGLFALGLAVWRKWYAGLFFFALAQLGVFFLVVEQVNRLPY